MNYQFTIQFTKEHIKYACRKFFFRRFGMGFPIICFLFAAFFLQQFLTKTVNWVQVSVFTFCVIVVFAFYFERRNRLISQLKSDGDIVRYEFSDNFFKATSNIGGGELKWEIFNGIWIFEKVWLLLIRDGGYFTFPVDQISNEVKEFLKGKIISVGGKIK